MDPEELLIIDNLCEVYDANLTIGTIFKSLNQLAEEESLKCIFLQREKLVVAPFSLKPFLPFPKLISWCAPLYSLETRQILSKKGTHVVCDVTA